MPFVKCYHNYRPWHCFESIFLGGQTRFGWKFTVRKRIYHDIINMWFPTQMKTSLKAITKKYSKGFRFFSNILLVEFRSLFLTFRKLYWLNIRFGIVYSIMLRSQCINIEESSWFYQPYFNYHSLMILLKPFTDLKHKIVFILYFTCRSSWFILKTMTEISTMLYYERIS